MEVGYASLGGQNAYAQEAALKQAYTNQAQSTAAQPMRESDAMVHKIAQQIEYLAALSNRLSSIADRTVGSRPKDVAAQGQIAGHPGHMPLSAKLGLLSDALGRVAQETNETIERLENFI